MHAGHFIEMATRISFQADRIVHSTSAELVKSEEFWTISKEKLEYWNKTLQIFKEDLTVHAEQHDSWAAISSVIEEILCSEFFVRVASAAFVLKDQKFETNFNGPVARAVFLFHLEARMRALELIEIGLETEVPAARTLNELRKRLESWCDLLLGFFPDQVASEFAINAERNRSFNLDIHEESQQSRKNVERLLLFSIKEYGRKLVKNPAANPTLNRKIADLFSLLNIEGNSEPSSFTSQAISDLTNEAERWIDDYLTV